MLSEKETQRVCAAAVAHNSLQQTTTVSKMLGRIHRPPEWHSNLSWKHSFFPLDTTRHQPVLLAVLDVPVLDLHYGGVLALVEWPAIYRIFLAALLLLQDRRPMRPVFHRVQPH